MNRSAVLNFKKIKFFDFFVRNKLLLLLCLLFALGVLLGTFSYSESETARQIANNEINSFLMQRQGRSFIAKMLLSVLSVLVGLFISFVFGTSFFGVVTVPAFICFCGFGYGCVSALLYAEFALKGVAFNGMVVLPPFLLFMVALMLASREAVSFSLVISRLMLPKSRPMNLCYDFKNYCGRYLLISLAAIFIAFIDAVLATSFLKLFNF